MDSGVMTEASSSCGNCLRCNRGGGHSGRRDSMTSMFGLRRSAWGNLAGAILENKKIRGQTGLTPIVLWQRRTSAPEGAVLACGFIGTSGTRALPGLSLLPSFCAALTVRRWRKGSSVTMGKTICISLPVVAITASLGLRAYPGVTYFYKFSKRRDSVTAS
jgi:hypothetical protein